MNSGRAIINKKVGQTPLEAMENFRALNPELTELPMTYAGRLDPMAEGELLILWGEECKSKEKYLGLDKEYEVEIMFGITTDTHDALGIPTVTNVDVVDHIKKSDLERYVSKFDQEYPAYSSKTFYGKQLHELARTGDLPEDMPTKNVEIYFIELLEQSNIPSASLNGRIEKMINSVKGDFRQREILSAWNKLLNDPRSFEVIKIRVKCSSGTYMRSLAHRIGQDKGTGALALAIKRTKIFI